MTSREPQTMVAVLLGIVLGQLVAQPPAIANVAGITLGRTTTQQFEQKFGKGQSHVGGHPNSGRTWFDTTSRTVIDTDGFNYSEDGLVIDGIDVDWRRDPPKGLPRIKVPAKSLGILAKLKKGMSPKQVEQVLGVKLTGGSFKAKGLIRFPGKLGNKDNDRYTDWVASFSFEKGALVGFRVMAD